MIYNKLFQKGLVVHYSLNINKQTMRKGKIIKNILEGSYRKMKLLLYRVLGKKTVKVYYWKKKMNFGDLITPSLLKYFGYTPIYSKPSKGTQLISTGSLIEHIKANFDGFILGTGAIDAKTGHTFPNAKILGLRGKYSKRNLNVEKDIVLGDPGIISSLLLNKRSEKKFLIGIIPHFSDLNNSIVQDLVNKYPSKIALIDVRNYPEQVLSEMDECRHILSSSLHGLICADSLGIPNKWIKLSQLLGDDFKFKDYYSVYDYEPDPLLIDGGETPEELISYTVLQDSVKIQKVKDGLTTAFRNLSSLVS